MAAQTRSKSGSPISRGLTSRSISASGQSMAMSANYEANCETASPASAQNCSLGWTNSFVGCLAC